MRGWELGLPYNLLDWPADLLCLRRPSLAHLELISRACIQDSRSFGELDRRLCLRETRSRGWQDGARLKLLHGGGVGPANAQV